MVKHLMILVYNLENRLRPIFLSSNSKYGCTVLPPAGWMGSVDNIQYVFGVTIS